MGKLIVKKFGGTSVADAERIEAVADNIESEIHAGNKVTVVLSAMGNSTDDLIKLAKIFDKKDIKVQEKGILNNVELRYDNEPARHKLLDVIGDLALCENHIQGHLKVTKP